MKKGSKVAIVCCSNGQSRTQEDNINTLTRTLHQMGMIPVFSPYIYAQQSVFSGSGKDRAESLMDFYRDPEIEAIFDISGGDIANEILPYLDYQLIMKSNKTFYGYSDLTVILNAIYAKTGKESVLYQIRNLIYSDAKNQITNFTSTMVEGTDDLYDFTYEVLQKERMQGIVVGGNIRCLLKLAGTEYWPDMNEKILLLEAYSGTVPQMATYLNQLKQMGVFGQINGILLGTFTKMEEGMCTPSIIDLVRQYAGADIPIAKTDEIGHGVNAKGIVIGRELILQKGYRK